MNILLAEDDEQLGELVAFMLKKKGGYRVEWVKEGRTLMTMQLLPIMMY